GVLSKYLCFGSIYNFCLLARTVMVKDENCFVGFDLAFVIFFEVLVYVPPVWFSKAIPEDWLRKEIEKNLSPEELAELEKRGSLEELLDEFRQRLEEQQGRHQGGNKWVGTGGTSPFGAYGAHPEGIRVGGESRNRSAVKVW